MFDWVNAQRLRAFTGAVLTTFLTAFLIAVSTGASAERLGLGKPATAEQIAGWDIDIRPDGKGLPEGQGTALSGEDVYIERCATCHGEFAEGQGRWPVLAGGEGSLDTHDPVKTVGSYWPYASTVFDYVRRAMPFGHSQSLTNDEVYAMTAFILNASDIIEDDFVVDMNTLPKIEMPNRDGFVADDRPDVPLGEPCMSNCLSSAPKIIGKARQVDVTPDDEKSAESDVKATSDAADAVAGEKVFSACSACHSLKPGEAKLGPTLSGIVGRQAGGESSFDRYSGAMTKAGFAWTEENLRAYLANPQGKVPGTSMPFGGIRDETQLGNLIAYLRKATQP